MTNFALYGTGALANGREWSSRIRASGNISEGTAATAIHTAWGDMWSAITTYLPAATTLDLTYAVTMSPTWKFSTATETTETEVGTSSDMSMPVSTCALVTWRTASRAKGASGRSFLPTAATNAIDTSDTGKLLAAFQTACKTGATNFFGALTGAGLTPVILDKATLTTRNITGPQVGNVFRSQERRQRKVLPVYA